MATIRVTPGPLLKLLKNQPGIAAVTATQKCKLLALVLQIYVTPFYFWSLADHFPDLVEWANSVLVAAYHGSAIRMEHFALSVNKMLKA